jgi:hypothetical protein
MLAVVAGSALSRWQAGLAVALGLLVGSANGFLVRRTLRSELGFRSASLLRLLALSVAGIGIASLLDLRLAPLVLAGMAVAQLVLAGVSVVQVVRA